MKVVATNVVKYKKDNPNTAILIITHLTNILQYIKPDYVHILSNGTIVKTGNYDLALEVEKNGYNDYKIESNTISKDSKDE